MKLTKCALALCLIGNPLSIYAIRPVTAATLTGLSAAVSAAGSVYMLQKFGTYLPEMSAQMYAMAAAAYITTSTIPTAWYLYKMTPQGRQKAAAQKLQQLEYDPLIKELVSGKDTLECMSNVYVNKDLPYIESSHCLQEQNIHINEVSRLLEKARKDIRPHEFELLQRNEQYINNADQLKITILNAIKRVKDLPDYTKRLKSFNENRAQIMQADAQKEQAKAQNRIAVGAILTGVGSIVSAGARMVTAVNPFKK